MRIEIHPAVPGRWDDVVDLFERRGPRGAAQFTAGCWCQYWHQRGKAFDPADPEGNRERLRAQVEGGEEPGLLAYADGVPVGWCRLGPRETFERLEHSPSLARVDDEPVWSLVCFAVAPAAKRQGVASALLEGAVAHAAAQGAPVLEAYAVPAGHHPVDSFTGYLPMFLAAGFEPVARRPRTVRTIVRRRLVKQQTVTRAGRRRGSTR